MASSKFSLNVSNVLKGFVEVNTKSLTAAEVGVGRAMIQLKTDMIMQRPTAPIKEGWLRGATSVHVQSKELNTPLGPGEKPGKALHGKLGEVKPGKIIGLIGVNVPYAARWHEVPAKFTEPSAGNKYLEAKMANNKMIYKKIISNAIAEGHKT